MFFSSCLSVRPYSPSCYPRDYLGSKWGTVTQQFHHQWYKNSSHTLRVDCMFSSLLPLSMTPTVPAKEEDVFMVLDYRVLQTERLKCVGFPSEKSGWYTSPSLAHESPLIPSPPLEWMKYLGKGPEKDVMESTMSTDVKRAMARTQNMVTIGINHRSTETTQEWVW